MLEEKSEGNNWPIARCCSADFTPYA